MRDHVDAIVAALATTGRPVHFVAASGEPPYYLVWSSSGEPPAEDAVAPVGDFEDMVGVSTVAGTPEGVLTLQSLARAALASFAAGSRVVPGRVMWLTLTDSRPVTLDRDVTIVGTNRHPAYGVDMYRLRSTPA